MMMTFYDMQNLIKVNKFSELFSLLHNFSPSDDIVDKRIFTTFIVEKEAEDWEERVESAISFGKRSRSH